MQEREVFTDTVTLSPTSRFFLYGLIWAFASVLLISSLVAIFAFYFIPIVALIAISTFLLSLAMLFVTGIRFNLVDGLISAWQEMTIAPAIPAETKKSLTFFDENITPKEVFWNLFDNLETKDLLSLRGTSHFSRKKIDYYILFNAQPPPRLKEILRHSPSWFGSQQNIISFQGVPFDTSDLAICYHRPQENVSFAGIVDLERENFPLLLRPDYTDIYVRWMSSLFNIFNCGDDSLAVLARTYSRNRPVFDAFYYPYVALNLGYEDHDFLEHTVLYQLNCLPPPALRAHINTRFRVSDNNQEFIFAINYKTDALTKEIKDEIEQWKITIAENAKCYWNEVEPNNTKAGWTFIINIRVPLSFAVTCLISNPVSMAIMFKDSLSGDKSEEIDKTCLFLIHALEQFCGLSAYGIHDEYRYFLMKELLEKMQNPSEALSERIKTYHLDEKTTDSVRKTCLGFSQLMRDHLSSVRVTIEIKLMGEVKRVKMLLPTLKKALINRITPLPIRIIVNIFSYLALGRLDWMLNNTNWHQTPEGKDIVEFALNVLMKEVDQLETVDDKLVLLRAMLTEPLFDHRVGYTWQIKSFFSPLSPPEKTAVEIIQGKINSIEKEPREKSQLKIH